MRETNLPATSLEHLRQAQPLLIMQSQHRINFLKQQVQKTDRYGSPLNNHIIIRSEHRRHLHTHFPLTLRILMKRLQSPLRLRPLQRQHTCVDEQTSIAVLGQAGHEFGAGEVDVHEFCHGLHEGVAQPLRELVEGHDGLPGLRGGGDGQGGELPGVAEGCSVDYGARSGPDGGEAVDEDGPEGWEGDDGDGGGEGAWMGHKIV